MNLELNERQLRLTLDYLPIPMLAHDETGRVRYVSEALLRATGHTREQIPTLAAWLDLVLEDPAEIDEFMAARTASQAAGAEPPPAEWEAAIRIADGSQRRWKISAYPLGHDVADAVNLIVGRDVTAERASADALALSEARLRQALQIGHAGNFERDFEARIVEYSDELLVIHGLPESRRRERFEQWFQRVHPADRGRVVAYAESLLDPDASLAVEYRIIRLNDGDVRRIAERRELRHDKLGRPVGCFGVQRDVTYPRAAERALRESETRLRMTLEAGQVGVFDWDLVADKLIWDERVREIWGLAANAPVTIAEFYRGVHPDDVKRLEADIARSHDAGGDGAYDTEYRVVNARDGGVRHVAARGRTWFDGGRARRMQGVVVEVTALREAQSVVERDRAELERLVEARTRELAEAQTRLAHAQRMEALGQLAGGIAHDFNNVLQAVEAAADLIERRPDPQNLPRYLLMAREATKRGSAISRRLLSFTHRAELEPEPVDARRLIEEVAGILRRTLGEGVKVETDCARDLPAVLADRRQLETALLNLAANARESMDGVGVLALKADRDTPRAAAASRFGAKLRPGEYVRFEICDTGRGMAPEVRTRATEPFFSTKPRGQGAGLGLSMAGRFAEHSGGGLRIDSEPGKGATVALWLPVAPTAPALTPATQTTGGGRLLLVDDDALVRELIGEQLRGAGFNVTVCDRARTAIERLDAGLAVDLLLTDFSMPEMNGIELAHEVRKRRPRLPVLVLTGFASEAADAAGDDDFPLLRKPIDRKALIARVTQTMAAR